MLTAATFFSAVTATTLQLSYAYNASTHVSLGVAVNTSWFVALVFSTASSLNSLVGLVWYQKIRRNQLLPDWAKLWVEYGPTISLAVASAAFSIGLCLFAFSSSQHTITSALTATFTIAHAVALFVPLCLYSPNRLSRFLLKVFTTPFNYCKEVYLRWWYLHRLPEDDRDLVVQIMRRRGVPWSKANIIDTQREIEEDQERGRDWGWEREWGWGWLWAPRNANPDSSSSPTGVEGSTETDSMFVRLSVHFVVAWLVTRWLMLYLRRTNANEESDNMEQAHEPGDSVDTLSNLERDIEAQGGAGNSGMNIHIPTEERDIVLSEGPRSSTTDVTNSDDVNDSGDVTDPDQGADLPSKILGEEVGHGSDTRPTSESMEELASVISSTAASIPGMSSSSAIRNPDNGLENVGSQETDAPGRPNTSQEEELGPPFDPSAQEGIEAHGIDASNPTFEIERRRKVALEESRLSADVVNPDNLK
ncbi:hypothetical protein M0805_009481 [Coniferiporia weirii]|nr:hypothetical protein M0805_009481 [Coniferiporia weirii]